MKRLVTGLPRSRTAWMSAWMTAHGAPCIHEMLAKVPSWEAYQAHLGTYGDSCTYGWLLPKGHFDRILVIERDQAEVNDSLEAAFSDPRCQFVDWDAAEVGMRDLGGLRIPFDDLNDWLPEIHLFFELPKPYDPFLTAEMCDLNIQMDPFSFGENVERAIANAKEALEPNPSG